MKKALSVLIMFIVMAGASFASDNTAKVKRVDKYIAVFDLEVTGKADKDVARPLTDSVRLEIIRSGKYEVIDRSNMDKILKEQAFQMTGCTQKDCAVEAGQLLGVGKIVVGTLSMVGKMYYLSISLVNVETGKTEAVVEDQCMCPLEELVDSSKRVANKLIMTGSGYRASVSSFDKQNPDSPPATSESDVTADPSAKTKSTALASLLGIVPGFGNYYVGSYNKYNGWSRHTAARGLLYTLGFLAPKDDPESDNSGNNNIRIFFIIISVLDAYTSADSYNEYYRNRLSAGFDYDPIEKTGLLKLSYSF